MYSSLVLVVYILFTPVEDRVGAQIESTLLSIIGILAGLGWSNAGLALAVVAHNAQPGSTAGARAIRGIFFALLAFANGFFHLHGARLRRAATLSLFLGVWTLVTPTDSTEITFHTFGPLFYSALLATAASLVAGLLVFPRTASHQFARQVMSVLDSSEQLLLASCRPHFVGVRDESTVSTQHQLKEAMEALPVAFAEGVYEVSYGRLRVDELQPILGIGRRLVSVFASGMAPHARCSLDEEKHEGGELEKATEDLVGTVVASFALTRRVIGYVYLSRRGISKTPMAIEPKRGRDALAASQDRFRIVVQTYLDLRFLHARLAPDEQHSSRRTFFRTSYFCTSLLQVAQDAERALRIADRLLVSCRPRKRIFLPRFDWALISGRERSSGIGELFQPGGAGMPLDDNDEEPHRNDDDDPVFAEINQAEPKPLRLPHQHLRNHWNSPASLNRRHHLSKFFHSAYRSPSLRFALKECIGCSALAIPAFLPLDSPGATWFVADRFQWAIISFIFVLDHTTGGTQKVSLLRICGTIFGAGVALLIWVICRTNPYGLVVLITLCAVPMHLVSRTSYGVVAVVAAVTLPPISLGEYLHLQRGDESIPHIALTRGYDIILGILAAVVVTHLFWPAYAHRDFHSHAGKSLEDASKFYLSLSRQNLRADEVYHPIIRSRFEHLESEMQRRLLQLETLLEAQHLEFSLLPKPTRRSRELLDALGQLNELFIALRFIRMHIPRKLAVTSVLPLRTELVSAVHLNLFACAAAFRSLRPLPQFLPSSRHALHALLDTIHAHLDGPAAATSSPSFALVFAFAEGEVLEELVEVVERLVDVARAFFGTQTFLVDEMASGMSCSVAPSRAGSGTVTPVPVATSGHAGMGTTSMASGMWEGWRSSRPGTALALSPSRTLNGGEPA